MKEGRTGGGVLHLLLTAEAEAWRECRSCCRPDDTVVLLDAAVLSLGQEATSQMRRFSCRVAVSLPDAHARGMPDRTMPEGADLVSDAQLVELIAGHRLCLTWR